MAKEIERKFLFAVKTLADCAEVKEIRAVTMIEQGYFDTQGAVVRVRLCTRMGTTKGEYTKTAYLTIKGPSKGIVRDEFEYEIPFADAQKMMLLCASKISKVRSVVAVNGLNWEVDYFPDFDKVLVEVELDDENQKIKLPSFVGKEVSEDKRYGNKNLAKDGWPKS